MSKSNNLSKNVYEESVCYHARIVDVRFIASSKKNYKERICYVFDVEVGDEVVEQYFSFPYSHHYRSLSAYVAEQLADLTGIKSDCITGLDVIGRYCDLYLFPKVMEDGKIRLAIDRIAEFTGTMEDMITLGGHIKELCGFKGLPLINNKCLLKDGTYPALLVDVGEIIINQVRWATLHFKLAVPGRKENISISFCEDQFPPALYDFMDVGCDPKSLKNIQGVKLNLKISSVGARYFIDDLDFVYNSEN